MAIANLVFSRSFKNELILTVGFICFWGHCCSGQFAFMYPGPTGNNIIGFSPTVSNPIHSSTQGINYNLSISLKENWLVADQHYDHRGEIVANVAEYGVYATSLIADYTVKQRLMTSIAVPVATYVYSRLPLSGTKQADWRTGELRARVLYNFLPDRHLQLLGAIDVGFPLTKAAGFEIQPTTHFSAHQRIMIQLRKPYYESRLMWWVFGGFRNLSKGLSDEWHYGVSGNFSVSQAKFGFCLCGTKSLGNGDPLFANYPETLYANNSESLLLSPFIEFKLSQKVAVQLGVDVPVYAKNTLANTMYELFVRYRTSTISPK